MSFVNYDALVRAIVSFLVPGLGQFINDEIEKGLKILVGFLIIWFALLFLNLFHIRTIVGIIIRLYAAYDAYISYSQ